MPPTASMPRWDFQRRLENNTEFHTQSIAERGYANDL